MLTLLSIDNWPIIYKLLFVVTVLFHPNIMFRKFAVGFSVSMIITGLLKEYYLEGSHWFMMQTVHELVTILLAGRLLYIVPVAKWLVIAQELLLILLNVYQFQTITDCFVPPDK